MSFCRVYWKLWGCWQRMLVWHSSLNVGAINRRGPCWIAESQHLTVFICQLENWISEEKRDQICGNRGAWWGVYLGGFLDYFVLFCRLFWRVCFSFFVIQKVVRQFFCEYLTNLLIMLTGKQRFGKLPEKVKFRKHSMFTRHWKLKYPPFEHP